VRAHANDLGMIDVDALGRRVELTQRVHRRRGDEAVTRGRSDRTFREANGFVGVARQGDPHE
jgi:hypothetical protein